MGTIDFNHCCHYYFISKYNHIYYITVPSVPRSLTVDGVNDSSVSLSWMSPDPANGIITQYMMEYRRSVDSSYASVTLSATILMYTVSGLDVDTEYQFRVRASTSVGNGNYSSEISQQTCKKFIV